ncbi:MAG TPA: hypothetical protein VMS71_02310 [Candidatus Acidoferrum sp.]|nr:hypothetical protein [Candidatus Acidoferrum sp.]
MKTTNCLAGSAVLLVVAYMILTGPALAQVAWLSPMDGRGISLEILKPSLDGSGWGFGTSVLNLTARVPATDQLSLMAQLGIANASLSSSYADYSYNETQFGNLYFGAELGGKGSTPIAELGVWLPMASDEKELSSVVGMLTTWDRFQVYASKMTSLTFRGGYKYVGPPEPGVQLKFLVGPTYMKPNEGDGELFADYSAECWIRRAQFGVGAGFTGRAWITESDLSFGERSVHLLGMAGYYDVGQCRLGGTFRIPIDDDLSSEVSFVYGVSISFMLK